MDLDWLIIGGGIHGVHIATRLLGQAEIPAERLRIVDPGERLLARWRTAITGMTHLRSPVVHHLDLGPWSLKRFAGKPSRRPPGLFAAPYDRPALSLFNRHCDKVVADYGLAELHIRDRAVGCELGCEGVTVALASGERLQTQNLVLAVGASEQPFWPGWAREADAEAGGVRVEHVFAGASWPSEPERVAVVGGGISAGQIALRLQREGHDVHLVSRHALREHQFDSEPGWLGPKFMTGFSKVRDFDHRRRLIDGARHRGSVPPDVRRALRHAIGKERLCWHKAEVAALDAGTLRLSSGEQLQVDRVLLATGFEARRPGGALVDQLVAAASLPCAGCGYPIVDAALRWHPRVFVTGPLAELELGPASRNIAGARRAGDRLMAALGD